MRCIDAVLLGKATGTLAAGQPVLSSGPVPS